MLVANGSRLVVHPFTNQMIEPFNNLFFISEPSVGLELCSSEAATAARKELLPRALQKC